MAISLLTSPIAVNVPTRGALVLVPKDSFVSVVYSHLCLLYINLFYRDFWTSGILHAP